VMEYDRKCRQCDDGVIVRDEQEETCNVCDGYGHLLTGSGRLLIEFLKRRGIAVPMSPRAEEELQGTVE
jgi:hypothetical protein